MHTDRPSTTAALVAALRSLAVVLPEDAQLSRDPYGFAFAERRGALLRRLATRWPRITRRVLRWSPRATRELLWMQLRTRVIDDAVEQLAANGCRQVLLLGAGYDTRALRLLTGQDDLLFFEVDHPSTQAHKRAVLARERQQSARARYLAWDFEARPLSELPDALAALGHDAARPTLTIWEGVTMYLSRDAIEASLQCIHALSAPGSRLVLTYFDRRAIEHPNPLRSFVARVGEPLRFGWNPGELGPHLAAHGFELASDESIVQLARRLLPAAYAELGFPQFRRVASAIRP